MTAAWLLLLPAAPLALLIAAWMAERLVYPEEGSRLLSRFYDDARRRGLTAADATEELRLRTILARIRRMASADTIADPARPLAHIRGHVAAEAEALLRADLKAGKRFLEWAATLRMTDVLYPEAVRAVRAHDRASRSGRAAAPPLTEDEDAALRRR